MHWLIEAKSKELKRLLQGKTRIKALQFFSLINWQALTLEDFRSICCRLDSGINFVLLLNQTGLAVSRIFLKYGARDKMKPGIKLKSLGVYMVHFEGCCYWIDYNFLPEISGNMLWIWRSILVLNRSCDKKYDARDSMKRKSLDAWIDYSFLPELRLFFDDLCFQSCYRIEQELFEWKRGNEWVQ